MNRRTFLSGTVGAGALLLSGCLAGGPGAGPGDGDETTTDGGNGTTTSSGNETTTENGGGNETTAVGDDDAGSPALSGTEFAVVSADCGVGASDAKVSLDDAAGTVAVEGTITAPSACYTASLADARYGGETDSLWVDVVTERPEDAGVCAQCLTEVEYRATLSFEGGLPARVAVTHDGEVVREKGAKSTTTSA